MRVSIWQQFSSNNSSSYVIIGSFATPERANEAAAEFKTLLQRLWEWYQAHPEIRDAVLNEEGHELTDAERQIGKDYNIEFEDAVEWIAREETLEFLPDAVTTFENLLFVATVTETVTEDTPFAHFMYQLGARVEFEEEMQAYLLIGISARAPDASTALFIKSVSEAYFMRDHNILWQRPPWVLFYDGRLAPDPEQLSGHIDTFIANYHARRAWRAQHEEQFEAWRLQREAAWKAKDHETAELLTKQIISLASTEDEVEPRLPKDVQRHIHKIASWTSMDADDHDKTVSIKGEAVKFPYLYFLPDDLGHGLPAIVTWLRALGCQDVRYKLIPLPAQ